MNDIQQMKTILEAAILAAGEPLSLERLRHLFDEHEKPSTENLRQAIAALIQDCAGRGIELKEVASGFCFQVKPELGPWIKRLWQERPVRYSRAFLETLAIIAYRQPITRAEIEDIRGVAVSPNIIKTLLDREWVRVVGQREVPGRPSIFATTRQFLDHFSLKSLEELPTLADIADLEAAASQLESAVAEQLEAPLAIEHSAQSLEESIASEETEEMSEQISEEISQELSQENWEEMTELPPAERMVEEVKITTAEVETELTEVV